MVDERSYSDSFFDISLIPLIHFCDDKKQEIKEENINLRYEVERLSSDLTSQERRCENWMRW